MHGEQSGPVVDDARHHSGDKAAADDHVDAVRRERDDHPEERAQRDHRDRRRTLRNQPEDIDRDSENRHRRQQQNQHHARGEPIAWPIVACVFIG